MRSRQIIEETQTLSLHQMGEPMAYYDLYSKTAYVYLSQDRHNVQLSLYMSALEFNPVSFLPTLEDPFTGNMLLSEVPSRILEVFTSPSNVQVNVGEIRNRYRIMDRRLALAIGAGINILELDFKDLGLGQKVPQEEKAKSNLVRLVRNNPMLTTNMEKVIYLSRFTLLDMEELEALTEMPLSYIKEILGFPPTYIAITEPYHPSPEDSTKRLIVSSIPPIWGRKKVHRNSEQ